MITCFGGDCPYKLVSYLCALEWPPKIDYQTQQFKIFSFGDTSKIKFGISLATTANHYSATSAVIVRESRNMPAVLILNASDGIFD